MKGVGHLVGAHLAVTLRERVTLFWFLVFPLLLLSLLTSIFGSLGEDQAMSFDLTLLRLAPRPAGFDAAGIVEHVLTELSQDSDERQALFRLTAYDNVDPLLYEREMENLRLGRVDAVVVLPEGFNAPPGGRPSEAEIHTSAGRTSSSMAHDILVQVFSSIDKSILEATGQFDPGAAISVERQDVGVGETRFSYVDFLLPGIVLMGLFTAGLFSVPGTILFGREQRILKQYWVTPLSAGQYLMGFGTGHLLLCGLQFTLIWILGRFAFGAQISFWSPESILFLAIGTLTSLAIGFLIASLAKTGNAGMAAANVINMPIMFLGGLFFPIGDLPVPLKAVLMINPLSYLADGLRAAVGVDAAVFPMAASVGVPLAWIVVCGIIASRRLTWEAAR